MEYSCCHFWCILIAKSGALLFADYSMFNVRNELADQQGAPKPKNVQVHEHIFIFIDADLHWRFSILVL